MMPDNQVTFEIESAISFEDRALNIARSLDQRETVMGQAHLSFPDMETLLKVLSPKRFALLRTLRQIGPSSIRALAAAVARDYKAVHGDVSTLIENGLIERQAVDRVAVLWDSLGAEFRLAA
jgi:predicted transcriptional regulator